MLLSGAQAALGTRVMLSGAAAAAAHRCCAALSCSLVTMLLTCAAHLTGAVHWRCWCTSTGGMWRCCRSEVLVLLSVAGAVVGITEMRLKENTMESRVVKRRRGQKRTHLN
jgi:hypothetical protein